VLNLFGDLNTVIMHMVEWIMRLAPYGVFALITRTFATQGLDLLLPLAAYFLTLTAALAIQVFGTYPLLLRLLASLNPLTFLKKMRDPAAFAFSTASSGATIPVTLHTVEYKMGVKNSVASFSVPLGATINMDGTAMMQGVATVFIANVYGVDLSLTDYLLVVLTATLASVGTAAIPGGRPGDADHGAGPGRPAGRGHRAHHRRRPPARHDAHHGQRHRRLRGELHRRQERKRTRSQAVFDDPEAGSVEAATRHPLPSPLLPEPCSIRCSAPPSSRSTPRTRIASPSPASTSRIGSAC
jgi:hypothetical protein